MFHSQEKTLNLYQECNVKFIYWDNMKPKIRN